MLYLSRLAVAVPVRVGSEQELWQAVMAILQDTRLTVRRNECLMEQIQDWKSDRAVSSKVPAAM